MLSDKKYCVVVTTAVALSSFVFCMRFLPDFLAWQGWDWCGDQCTVRDWLDASSGWVSAAIAAAAVLPLLLQLQTQQVQTAFSVGDAPPTIDAIEHLNNSTELVVRIVNWNRRGVVVRSLDIGTPGTIIMPNSLVIDAKEQEINSLQIGLEPFTIRGWEDRSKGPKHAEIRLVAFKIEQGSVSILTNWRDIPTISATVHILGGSHIEMRLSADTRLLWK